MRHKALVEIMEYWFEHGRNQVREHALFIGLLDSRGSEESAIDLGYIRLRGADIISFGYGMSDIPAAHEIIIDGETGVLHGLADIQDLATKTLALAQDPLLRQRLGDQARAAAVAYGPEHWVRAYEEVLYRTAAYHPVPS